MGEQGANTRVVFDFPSLTAYNATAGKDSVSLTFDTPLGLGAMPQQTTLIRNVTAARLPNNAAQLNFALAPGATFKHYRLLNKVVLDISPAAAAKPAPQKPQSVKNEPPKKPAPVKAPATAVKAPVSKVEPAQDLAKKETPPDTKTAAKTEDKKTTPVETVETPQPDVKTAVAPPAAPQDAPVSAQAAADNKALVGVEEKLAATAVLVDHPETATPDDAAAGAHEGDASHADDEDAADAPVTTISFSSVEPARAAVFSRFGTLWIVTDIKAAAATPETDGPEAGFLGKAKVMPFENGTAYRFTLPEGDDFAVAHKGLNWTVAVGKNVPRSRARGDLNTTFDGATRKGKLMAHLQDGGDVLTVDDPSVGDKIYVVPVSDPQQRVEQARLFPDVEILPAQAGMAVRPIADGIRVTHLGDYTTITSPDGILATPGASAVPSFAGAVDNATASAAPESSRRFFDFPNWQQGGITRLAHNQALLQQAVSLAATPDERSAALLRLALLYFANNFGHEALGVLRMIEDENPDMMKNPNIIALRGAAAAMAGHYDEALKDLSHPALQQNPEINLWAGYAAAASEQWRMADRSFPRNNRLLARYPSNISTPMTIYMAESALRLGRSASANELLDSLESTDDEAENAHYAAAVQYLKGEAARQSGDFAEAERQWKYAASGLDRLYHTKASMALAMLQLQQKEITVKQAVDALDSLRFAWRGDGLEVQIMSTLGKMRVQNGEYLAGLQDMKTAAGLSVSLQDDPAPIKDAMAQVVKTAFSENSPYKIQPLEVASLYSDFGNLLPEGAEGVEARLNFSDYLVRMDLLDRAEALIEQELSNDVPPEARPKVGAKLATVYLLDSRPALAIDALRKTEAGTLDEALATKRLLLKARAQSQLNLTDDAIATLAPLQNEDAQKLRADIYWQSREWGKAALAIEGLLPAPDSQSLTDEQARLILNAAVGYKLAGDAAGLENLRGRYERLMSATSLAPGFNVVTRAGGASGLADRDTILKIAGEVDMFKGLLDSYKAASGSGNDGTAQKSAPPAPDAPAAQDPVTNPAAVEPSAPEANPATPAAEH